MQNATALYCADTATSDAALQSAARACAKQGAHLAVLLHAEFPTLPFGAYGAMPYGGVSMPEAWPNTLRSAQTELRDRIEAVQELLSDEGASADVRPLFTAMADVREGVARAARTCDIAFLAPNLRDQETLYKEMVHSIFFNSPIVGVVNGTPEMSHKTVLLAWNNSLASARTAHLALPYLKSAEDVHITCFDAPVTTDTGRLEPGREAATWLSHHGCNVTLTQLPSGGREIGTCIIDHAGVIGADLIVAGAYGHSRLQQAVFGGTSRTLIQQTEVPVMMAH